VSVVDDVLPENAETVEMTLTGPINALFSLGINDTDTVTINDDDPDPTASINDPQITEGDTVTETMTFTITLSGASAKTATVDYALEAVSATAGVDYTSITGTLTFLPGDTIETVDVSIIGDLTAESDETFNLKLSNGVNISVIDDTGVGTILDNDTSELSIDSVSNQEGNSGTTQFVFTVTMNPVSAGIVTVDYATSNGTATEGSDYTAASGTLTFNPLVASQTITITAYGDTVYESDETFLVELSNVIGNAEISDTAYQGTGTIENDESQPILSIDSVNQNEGNSGTSTFYFSVSLSPASASIVTVDYATENGTATSGSDYTASTGTLTFNAEETSKTVSVTISGDRLVESDETFIVRLSNPSNAGFTGGVTSVTATGTVQNDDHAPTLLTSIDKEVDEDNTLSFSSSDFTNAYTDADSDALASITILTLPTNGVLKFNTTPIVINQVILAANLASIKYTPNEDYFGSDTFNWTASDGVNLASAASRVDIMVNSVNDPPTLDEVNDLDLIFSTSSQQISLSGITDGENGNIATLTVTAVSNNHTVLPDPEISFDIQENSWILTINPTGATGTAIVTVTIDDGNTENNIVTRTFTVTIEEPNLVILPTGSLVTDEGGATAMFSVTLGVKPVGNVTIAVSSTNPAEGTVSPQTLTFTPENWDTPQNVMITGVDDSLVDGDIEYQIILDPSGSSDSEYRTMGNVTVDVVNEDNETPVTDWFVFLPILIK
jgi:chitinase